MDFVLLVLDPLLESMLVAVRVWQVNCKTQPCRCSWNKLLFVLLFHILHCFTIFYYGRCVVAQKKRGESLTWLSFAPNTFSFSELWFDSSCCGASKPVRWSRSLEVSLALSSVTSVFGGAILRRKRSHRLDHTKMQNRNLRGSGVFCPWVSCWTFSEALCISERAKRGARAAKVLSSAHVGIPIVCLDWNTHRIDILHAAAMPGVRFPGTAHGVKINEISP